MRHLEDSIFLVKYYDKKEYFAEALREINKNKNFVVNPKTIGSFFYYFGLHQMQDDYIVS